MSIDNQRVSKGRCQIELLFILGLINCDIRRLKLLGMQNTENLLFLDFLFNHNINIKFYTQQ